MSHGNYDHDLRERIEELEIELDRLRGRVADLEGDADANGGDDTLPDGVTDRFDAHTIQALDPGETVSLSRLQALYREAGIRSDTTLKQRIKQITKMDYFETVGVQRWRFVGRPGREGEDEKEGGKR